MKKDEQEALQVKNNGATEKFKTSSFSNGTNCVAVARLSNGSVKVRDSKDPAGQTFTFVKSGWVAFVQGVKHGEFDPQVTLS